MTKNRFLANLRDLYRCGNRSDSGSGKLAEEHWTRPEMAGRACCAGIDGVIAALVNCGAVSRDEAEAFYSEV